MAELVDYNLIQAFQSATAPRQQAMRSFAETLGGSLGDVGSAIVGRQMDVKEKRRQLEAYKQALAQEQGQLQSEKQRLMDLLKTEQQPYKQVEVQTNLQNIDKRLGEIGSVSQTIPEDIGEAVRFRTYSDKNPAMLPKRQDAAPDYRDVEMRERQDAAERKAAQDAELLARQEAAKARERKEDRDLQLQLAQIKAKPERSIYEETLERETAKDLITQQKEQRAAEKAHAEIVPTVREMKKMIDKYGDGLFGADTAIGMLREGGGKLAGTELASARDIWDNLNNTLIELATQARKGQGTISDADLDVIIKGTLSRSVADKQAALEIADNILKKSARKAGSGKTDTSSVPPLLARPDSTGMDVESMLQSGEWEIVPE